MGCLESTRGRAGGRGCAVLDRATPKKLTTTMNIFERLLAPQLGRNYVDQTLRGYGNRAARRAIATRRGAEHLRDCGEDIYTDRPEILVRGACLLVFNRDFHPKID